MAWLDFLFRGKNSPGPTPVAERPRSAAAAPGTAIRHDPRLVEELHADHRQLLAVFGDIRQASQRGDLAHAQQQLERLRLRLKDHLLKENVRLYVYLEHLLADTPAEHALMRGFRREMDAIGRTVVDFFGRYDRLAAQPELATAFASDLAQIGEALVARIGREEESLYPMYRPPAE